MERLKEFVAGLDKKRDDKLLEHVRSKKSVMLYEMSKELEASTTTVCSSIEAFLATHKKYFGKYFNF